MKPKLFVLVLMSFEKKYDEIYSNGIRAAAEQCGAYCERVDEQNFEERILDRIYNQINKADIIVADMTGRKPNVFYEVGYAHALGKQVILLVSNSNEIEFNLQHHKHIEYGGSADNLKKQLSSRIQWCIDNPEKEFSSDTLQLLFGNQILETTSDNFVEITQGGPYVRFQFKLINTTNRIFSGKCKIGIYSEGYKCYLEPDTPHSHFVVESDRRAAVTRNYVDELLPQCSVEIGGVMCNLGNYPGMGQSFSVKLFREDGYKEFKIVVRWK